MKTLKIQSRVLAKDFHFYMAPKGGQVYVKDVDRYDYEPRPIAWEESGEPVKATPKSFKEVCHQWYEQQAAKPEAREAIRPRKDHYAK